jgi:hypothetical protein
MRWLEKSYSKILQMFKAELATKHGLGEEEVDICLELATQDLASKSLFRNLTAR